MGKILGNDCAVYERFKALQFSRTELARYYGVTLKTISKRLFHMQCCGYHIPTSKYDCTQARLWTDEEDALLCQLWCRGYTAIEISKELNRPVSQIYSRARKNELRR